MGGARPQSDGPGVGESSSGKTAVPVDEEKETLRERVQELEKKLDLAKKTIEVKELLAAYEEFRNKGAKKNRRIGKRR